MNETISFFGGVMISISSMIMVFAILYFLVIALNGFKLLFYKENFQLPVAPSTTPAQMDNDEEERLVVALTTTIMAGRNNPNGSFHISKIARVK